MCCNFSPAVTPQKSVKMSYLTKLFEDIVFIIVVLYIVCAFIKKMKSAIPFLGI